MGKPREAGGKGRRKRVGGRARGSCGGAFEQTICWDCANAVLGCSWSRSYTPVEGWDAVPTKVHRQEGPPMDSYLVRSCPEFRRDRR